MAKILEIDPITPQPERVARAAELIRQGCVVGLPTDTVYGLAADPFNVAAVERIFAAKGRSPEAPVLLLVDSTEMAAGLSKNLPAAFHFLTQRFWPGPLTIVVEASDQLPGIVTANTGRVGMRLPAAEIPRALIRALGGPITGTSANVSGHSECRSAAEVDAVLGKMLPLILDGGSSKNIIPSTVINLRDESWELVREGAIQRTELESVFGGLKAAGR
ncbi:MAG: threonylcarbamoyl-AMP synthase [Acidobacteria bacterium]|nr:threonylcarbamoyl-AMP synthase [Acidobacteriota bacterium]